MSTLVRTASGHRFDLLHPAPEDVDFGAMAEGLAKLNRWVGATPGLAISVAEHSVHVCRALSPAARPYGLLHDGHEYVIGDWTRSVQQALAAVIPGFAAGFAALVEPIDAAIHHAAGLAWPPPPEIAAEVADADDARGEHERFWLFPYGEDVFDRANIVLPQRVMPLPTWRAAHDLFLAELRQLLPHVLP